MIQYNSIGNILNDIPDNGTIGFGTIVEGSLIAELQTAIQNSLNKINKILFFFIFLQLIFSKKLAVQLLYKFRG